MLLECLQSTTDSPSVFRDMCTVAEQWFNLFQAWLYKFSADISDHSEATTGQDEIRMQLQQLELEFDMHPIFSESFRQKDVEYWNRLVQKYFDDGLPLDWLARNPYEIVRGAQLPPVSEYGTGCFRDHTEAINEVIGMPRVCATSLTH